MAARRRVAEVCRVGREVPLKWKKTGAQVARAMLEAGGLEEKVRVIEQRGMLPDAYDASKRIVYLKSENFHGTVATAVGVAAHETAHALQHRDAFTALSFRMSAIKLSQVVSGMVLIVAVVVMFLTKARLPALAALGGCWAVFMVMNVMTLPVEFEASKRAKRLLKKLGVLANRDEGEAVGRVLSAMALANLGAMLGSVPYLVYHLLPGFGRKGVVEAEVEPEPAPEGGVGEAGGRKALDAGAGGEGRDVIEVEAIFLDEEKKG